MPTRRATSPDDHATPGQGAWVTWLKNHGLPADRIPMGASFTVDDEHQLIAYDVFDDIAAPDGPTITVAVHEVGHPIADFPAPPPDARDHVLALHLAVKGLAQGGNPQRTLPVARIRQLIEGSAAAYKDFHGDAGAFKAMLHRAAYYDDHSLSGDTVQALYPDQIAAGDRAYVWVQGVLAEAHREHLDGGCPCHTRVWAEPR